MDIVVSLKVFHLAGELPIGVREINMPIRSSSIAIPLVLCIVFLATASLFSQTAGLSARQEAQILQSRN